MEKQYDILNKIVIQGICLNVPMTLMKACLYSIIIVQLAMHILKRFLIQQLLLKCHYLLPQIVQYLATYIFLISQFQIRPLKFSYELLLIPHQNLFWLVLSFP